MSLFHIHEWLALDMDDAVVCAVGELLENRDQIVVGNLTGHLWIIDPGRATDSKQQLSCLLEEELPCGIVDIAIANFVTNLEQNLIAILLPQKLIIYRLIKDGEIHRLKALYEHNFEAVAYNMCIGTFGHASTPEICVQNINCSLMVFEAEHQMFCRSVTSVGALYPGPIIYAPQSDSIISASSCAVLASYKFSTLATASGGNYGKKLSADWVFSLGDYPLELAVIDIAPVQPSIVVLCKRTLFCLTHGGTLRFSIRLQYVATSLLVYSSTSDAYVQLCITTATRMLLFFTDSILVWAAQLLYNPIQVKLCTFSSVYRSMLVLLSSSRISVSYLGTEPSLFRFPASQTRFIDFDQRYKEFMELEAEIHKKPADLAEGSTSKTSLTLKCWYDGLDAKSQAKNPSKEVPSLSLNIELTGVRIIDVKLTCFMAFHTDLKYASFATIDGSEKLTTVVYVADEPVYDLRCKFWAFSAQLDDVVSREIKMPLNLMCRITSAQRNAKYKLTIESSVTALEMTHLFPEFETECSSAIGFRPFLSETVISLYASQKSKRYRIQADTLDFVYLFTDELITRIQTKQPEAKLSCTLPLDQILHELNAYAEMEKRREMEEKRLETLCTLFRSTQAASLTKLKVEQSTEVDHMNSLMDYTNKQVLSCLEDLERLNMSLRASSSSLSAVLNLLQLILSQKGKNVFIDGNIVSGSEQLVWERVKWAISAFQSIDKNMILSSSNLRNFLKNFWEDSTDRMEFIYEDSGDEEDMVQQQDSEVIDPLISGSLAIQ